MRFLLPLLAISGLATAAAKPHAVCPRGVATPTSSLDSTSTSTSTSTSISTSTSTSTSSSTSTTSSPTSTTAVTVAADGSGQFTAIGDAIAYAQSSGIPTVTVSAGTYTEAITISATPTVTVVGQSSNEDDYSSNEVTITNSATVLTINNNVKQVSFKNINFSNTGATYGAMILKGNKYAFYDCQIVSSGSLGITASVGLGVVANSYIEALDKVIYGAASLYVYNTDIVPVDSSALITYMKGTTYTSTSVLYNSTVVFDHVTVAQKSGASNKNVYLAAANGAGTVVVYRNSALGGLIAASGAHVDTTTQSSYNFFAEYSNTGSGDYANNAASRSTYMSALDASQVSDYSISAVFAAAYPSYASSDLSWVESSVLDAIDNADVIQTSTSVSSSTAAATTLSTAVATTSAASTVTTSSSTKTSSAAQSSSTYVVDQSLGPYKSITAAIAALPSDSNEYTIYVKAGTYNEQISVTRKGLTIIRGETEFENDYTQNTVTVEYSIGVLTSAGQDETTPVVNAKNSDGKGLALYNINFQNTYPQTSNTAALAADFYGNVQAYGCSFIGYQDTLLANKGTQVFSNCYVEGSVDYIWGFSTAYFYQSVIAANTAGASIAAMSRSSATATGGYVFDNCLVTYTSTYGSTYQDTWLGRPYSEYSIVVYMNSYLDKHINPAGWHVWSTSSPQTDYVTFGEFNNTGPSSWSSSRASFATNLTATEAEAYTLTNWIGDTSWLDMDAYNYVPSYSLTGASTTTTTSTTTSTNSTSTSTASSTATATWAHPTSGTVPPTGAVLVDVSGTVDGAYRNLTDALDSLPDDSSTQIIFMYAGTYDEQVPSINRDGPVMIIGYTTGNPGQSYADNEVTITFSRGLSVSPLPTGHSDAETATVSTASTQIAFYNVNIVNSDNLDGSESSYVTLAASIYGNHIAFYGVYFQGWQDTLLTGATAGYQYYESSYIEGAIDFIWGYSKAYFKGCTIGAKRAKSAMTAQSRASSSAIGGYIFDQTLFTAAADATVDLTETVYLGRPYSKYALVVIKNSYMTDVVNPSGWKVWSTTDPRTDYITFAEFNNSGPGNWENNEAAREAFGYATLLTEDSYSLETVMDSTDWIDMTYWDSIDTPTSVSGVSATTTATATATASATATAAYDGTTPPTGAYIVSKTSLGSNTTTYDTIQSALDAIPTSSKITPTIFIYPGTYEEQLVVSKSGSVILVGYSTSTYDYNSNQVTIQYNHGIDTQADESNSDGATVYATGNYFEAININFVNNNGTAKDIATLGFAVKSSKYASLYGCQVKGNQDALLINGYLWMSNGYVEGNIDMIWGSGSAYFLNTTISPNEDSINLTADKRSTSTTAGGFVFDQCTITPSTGAGTMSKISLGRPWNSYARVAYIDSYLDSCVEAAGWNQWSSSTPNTDGVTFAEYGNYGPGSSTASRASFATQLTDSGVVQFELTNFFAATSWIDFTHVDGTPFVPDTTTATVTSTAVLSTATSSLVSSTVATDTVTDLVTVKTTSTSEVLSTVTPTDKTSTVKSTITVTNTPDAVTKTTTEKSTITSTETITEPITTTTKTSVVTVDVGTTITPDAKTVTTTDKSTSTDTVTVTGKATTTTVKSTVTATSTVTAKVSTVTDTETATTTSVKTTSAKGTTTTSTSTVTTGTGGTTTISTKATTETVTSTSTKTSTKTTTTTVSCDSAAKIKRDILPRDVIVTVTAYTTDIDVVLKTSTTKLPTATDYVTSVATKTTSVKASTITDTITSIATKVSTTTIPAVTSTVTIVDTTSVGKTTTLKASTITSTVTSAVEKATTVTLPGSTTTTTSLKTTTVKSTLSLPQSTVTTTKTTTVKSTSTIPATTSTVIKTTTVTNSPSVTITERATSTSTKVQSTTTTVTVTATKTAKCS